MKLDRRYFRGVPPHERYQALQRAAVCASFRSAHRAAGFPPITAFMRAWVAKNRRHSSLPISFSSLHRWLAAMRRSGPRGLIMSSGRRERTGQVILDTQTLDVLEDLCRTLRQVADQLEPKLKRARWMMTKDAEADTSR